MVRTGSVAPPGWVETTGLPPPTQTAPPPTQTAPPPTQTAPPPTLAPDAPDAILGGRISAAIIDNILVWIAYLVLSAVLGWRVLDVGHLWVWLVLALAYHFVCECRDGQTIGKRHYGICVRASDGQRASPRAVAIRTALRLIDQLPGYWTSAFVTMVHTGPARRQRIGDVLGGTVVVRVAGLVPMKRRGAWVLPTATIVSFLASGALVFGLLDHHHQTMTPTQRAEFIEGCQRAEQGVAVDCECLLTGLESEGYTSIDDIRKLMDGVAAETDQGQRGSAHRALLDASLGCAH